MRISAAGVCLPNLLLSAPANSNSGVAAMRRAILVCLSLLTLVLPAVCQDDKPTIKKDWVALSAWTNNSYHKSYATWSWVPQISFRVNGPLDSADQLYVEASLPTGPWVKFDCK